MIEEPTKHYQVGEDGEQVIPELPQPDQHDPDQQQLDSQQLDSQQPNTPQLDRQQSQQQESSPDQPDGTTLLSNNSCSPTASEHIPLSTLTKPNREDKEEADEDASGGTHLQQRKTAGEKDDTNKLQDTEM